MWDGRDGAESAGWLLIDFGVWGVRLAAMAVAAAAAATQAAVAVVATLALVAASGSVSTLMAGGRRASASIAKHRRNGLAVGPR